MDIYKEDLALINQQWLICHKRQPNHIIIQNKTKSLLNFNISVVVFLQFRFFYCWFFFPFAFFKKLFLFIPALVGVCLLYIYIYIYIHPVSPQMAEQGQDDQLEHTYSSHVRIRDVALRTCQRRWTTGRSGERGSRIPVLAARHDDYIYIYIYIYICVCVCVCVCDWKKVLTILISVKSSSSFFSWHKEAVSSV